MRSQGNTNLITSETSSAYKSSITGASFSQPDKFVAPTGRRRRLSEEAARALAAKQIDDEAAAASTDTEDTFLSTTQTQFSGNGNAPRELATMKIDDAVVNAAPTSFWSDQGKTTKRSTAFSDGVRTDELIAAGQL